MMDFDKWIEYGYLDEQALRFDNPSFDGAIIGVDSEGKLVYSFDKMVIKFAEENDLDYIEALEFVEYNTMRALPYFGDYAPIVVYDDIEV